MGYKGRRGRRSFGRARGSRDRQVYSRGSIEMHKGVCADCGKECEVPFKPTGDRPVYCQECWAKRRSTRKKDSYRQEYSQEARQKRPSSASENIDLQILAELKRIRKALEKGTT